MSDVVSSGWSSCTYVNPFYPWDNSVKCTEQILWLCCKWRNRGPEKQCDFPKSEAGYRRPEISCMLRGNLRWPWPHWVISFLLSWQPSSRPQVTPWLLAKLQGSPDFSFSDDKLSISIARSNSSPTHMTLPVSGVFLPTRIAWKAIVFLILAFQGNCILYKVPELECATR